MSDSEEETPVLKRSESLRDKTWLFSNSRLTGDAMFPKSARKELWYTYGISSFSFSIIGFLMIYDRCHSTWFAIFLEFLLVLQGPISFLNDVHYLGYPTIWRPIDRFWATFTTIVAVLYIAWFGWTAEIECTPRKDQFMVMWPTIFLGISFYACSYQAAKKKDMFKYQIFHIFWHLSLPCAGSYVILFWLYKQNIFWSNNDILFSQKVIVNLRSPKWPANRCLLKYSLFSVCRVTRGNNLQEKCTFIFRTHLSDCCGKFGPLIFNFSLTSRT